MSQAGVYQIRQAGHPVLWQKASEVTEFGKPLKALARSLFRSMQAAHGVGLAAPQIGKSTRVAVVAAGGFRAALVNPVILSSFGQAYEHEGCLSVSPSRWRSLRRALSVRVRWQDLDGNVQEQQLDGFAARAVQHEIDHLDGVLITDRAKS